MAVLERENFRPANNFIKSALEFEIDIREKLKWSNKQWLQEGEKMGRLKKLCNSLNFWKNKLKTAIEDTSIVITVFNAEKDVKMDLFQIVSAIENLNPNIQVVGFANFRNPRYICLYFKSKSDRDTIRDSFRMIENNYVVYLSWALETSDALSTLKVHWLPMTLNIDIIKKALDKYVSCVEEERIALNFMSGRDLPSGKVTFKVKFKKGVVPEAIPHLMTIAEMEALITVAGRQPKCLNCFQLGHVSKDCKLRYCKFCNGLQFKEHLCTNKKQVFSYAAVLKDSKDYAEPDDWGAAINIKENARKVDERVAIEQKISGIQNQILSLQSEDLNHELSRPEKKREVDTLLTGFDTKTSLNSSLLQEAEGDVFEGSCDSQSDNSLFMDEDQGNFVISENLQVSEESALKFNEALHNSQGSGRRKKKNDNKLTSGVVANDAVAVELKTYGRQNKNNSRKNKQEGKFEKLSEKREFVFKD